MSLFGSTQLADVPVEHLDFGFVEKCTDPQYLRTILGVLESGREGKFPDLERVVDARLLACLSPAERAREVAIRHVPDRAEKAEALEDKLDPRST